MPARGGDSRASKKELGRGWVTGLDRSPGRTCSGGCRRSDIDRRWSIGSGRNHPGRSGWRRSRRWSSSWVAGRRSRSSRTPRRWSSTKLHRWSSHPSWIGRSSTRPSWTHPSWIDRSSTRPSWTHRSWTRPSWSWSDLSCRSTTRSGRWSQRCYRRSVCTRCRRSRDNRCRHSSKSPRTSCRCHLRDRDSRPGQLQPREREKRRKSGHAWETPRLENSGFHATRQRFRIARVRPWFP